MPDSAIAASEVDRILALEDIGPFLGNLFRAGDPDGKHNAGSRLDGDFKADPSSVTNNGS
jgi:hypothetical protein